jgi:hypothetical protein
MRDMPATVALYVLIVAAFGIMLVPDLLLKLKKGRQISWQRNPPGNNKV